MSELGILVTMVLLIGGPFVLVPLLLLGILVVGFATYILILVVSFLVRKVFLK